MFKNIREKFIFLPFLVLTNPPKYAILDSENKWEKSWGKMTENERIMYFLYGVLAVLGIEFLFYMLVLIVWGKGNENITINIRGIIIIS